MKRSSWVCGVVALVLGMNAFAQTAVAPAKPVAPAASMFVKGASIPEPYRGYWADDCDDPDEDMTLKATTYEDAVGVANITSVARIKEGQIWITLHRVGSDLPFRNAVSLTLPDENVMGDEVEIIYDDGDNNLTLNLCEPL